MPPKKINVRKKTFAERVEAAPADSEELRVLFDEIPDAVASGFTQLNGIIRDHITLHQALLDDFPQEVPLATTRGDDSSDDEHSAPSFATPDLWQRWHNFNTQAAASFRCDRSLYSFVSHDIGVSILRSQAVHTAYWQALAKRLPAKESITTLLQRIQQELLAKITQHFQTAGLKPITARQDDYQQALQDGIGALAFHFARRSSLRAVTTFNKQRSKELTTLFWDRLQPCLQLPKQTPNQYKNKFIELITSYNPKAALVRSCLPPATPLLMRSSVEFFSSLFLSLRSSKRRGRHLIHHGKGLPNDQTPVVYSFNGTHQVCELQILCKGDDRSRRDEVIHFGNYTDIAGRIQFFGFDSPTTAPQLAKLLRAILTFNALPADVKTANPFLQDDFIAFAHQLALLLGGTEAIRNPSALVHTMMLLDLVEHQVVEYENWKTALVNKMPMAIAIEESGERTVVSAARYLHFHYSKHQASYQYPGILPSGTTSGRKATTQEEKVNQLSKREDNLVQDWLRWKQNTTEIRTTVSAQKEHLQLILNACQTWFPEIIKIPRPTAVTTFASVLNTPPTATSSTDEVKQTPPGR